MHEKRKYLHIYYPSYLLRKIFSAVHKKYIYTKMYKTQKLINQFLDQVKYPI